MGQIVVRKINDETLDALKLRASELQLPLEAYVRSVLEKTAHSPTMADLAVAQKKLEELWSKQKTELSDSVPLVRAERDNVGR